MTFGAIAFVLIVILFALVAGVVPPRARLVVWTVVVAGGVVPWMGWVGHSHWARIEWLPFSGVIRPRDVFLNILFYVPIGVFFATGRGSRPVSAVVTRAGLFGLMLSVITEATQVYSHGRFPAATDVATNTIGAVIGAWVTRAREPRTVAGRPPRPEA